jgi:chromosome segregation ATPase
VLESEEPELSLELDEPPEKSPEFDFDIPPRMEELVQAQTSEVRKLSEQKKGSQRQVSSRLRTINSKIAETEFEADLKRLSESITREGEAEIKENIAQQKLINILTSENSQLKSVTKTLQSRTEELQEEVEELQQSSLSLRGQVNRLEEDVHQLEEENAGLLSERALAETRAESEKEKAATLSMDVVQIQSQLQAALRDVTQLRDENSKLRARLTEEVGLEEAELPPPAATMSTEEDKERIMKGLAPAAADRMPTTGLTTEELIALSKSSPIFTPPIEQPYSPQIEVRF